MELMYCNREKAEKIMLADLRSKPEYRHKIRHLRTSINDEDVYIIFYQPIRRTICRDFTS